MEVNKNELILELNRLFETAKKFDEFEFVSVLIGYNGMGDQRALTHLYESREFIKEIKTLINTNSTSHGKIRLGLLLYCHIFEMDELYNIIGSLLRISMGLGHRFVPDLFNSGEESLTPTDKFNKIKILSEQSRFEEFYINWFALYSNKIRNAYFHSSYSLIEDDFCIVKGDGIKIGSVYHRIISIENYLTPLINSTIVFIDEFFSLIDKYKLEYRTNKIVQGRLPETQPVLILGDPSKGLIGFQSFKNSGVRIKEAYGSPNFVEALNLTFAKQTDEVSSLSQQLLPYLENQKPVGKEFVKLKQAIQNTKDVSLQKDLAIVYYNWANNTVKAAEEKSAPEKFNLLKLALQRYALSIETNSEFGRAYLNLALTELKISKLDNFPINDSRLRTLESLKIALKYEPLLFEAFVNIGMIKYEIAKEEKELSQKEENFKEAIFNLKQAIEIYSKESIVHQYLASSYWQLATISEVKKDYYESSITALNNLIILKPELNHYLSLSMTLGDYAESETENSILLYERSIMMIKEAEKIYGVTSDTQLRLGNKYMMLALKTDNLELLNTAQHTYQKAIELDENNVSALNNLGHNLLNLGLMDKTEKAIYYFKEAVKKCSYAILKDPNSENPYYNLGISYTELWKRNDSDKKENLLNLALKNLIHGESLKEGHCAFYLAKIHALINNIEKTVVWLDKFLDFNKVDKDYIISDPDFNLVVNKEEIQFVLRKYF